MRKLSRIAILASIAFSVVGYAGGLTEHSVRELIARVDGAANAMNIAPIAESLSDDVVISMTISVNGQRHTLRPSKREYLEMLRQGWAAASSYQYRRESLDIRLESENRARVTAEVTESMVIQGQYIRGNTREEATIELLDGEPKVTKLVGSTTM